MLVITFLAMELSEIQTALAEGAHKIFAAAMEVQEKRTNLDRAKREVDKARAMAVINNQNAKNQTVLNALVENDTAVSSAENEVITAHGDYLSAIARHEREKDTFDAAKKAANMIEAEMRSFGSQRSTNFPSQQ